jgi:hypothetical protein
MKTFKQIREDMVNYNHTTQSWQIRHDTTGHAFKVEKSHVILKDAKPHVNHDAHEAGKKIYAYMHGTPVPSVPKGHKKREIKFSHKDDNSPVTHANYVEFKGREAHAHYK